MEEPKEVEVNDELVDEDPEESTIDIDGFVEFIANGMSGCLIIGLIVGSVVIVTIFSINKVIYRLGEMERKIEYCYQEHKRLAEKQIQEGGAND